MKLSKSLGVLLLTLNSLPAMSAGLEVQGNLITSESSLYLGKKEVKSSTGSSETTDSQEKHEYITAPGAGLSVSYGLTDAVKIGGAFSWVDYQGNDEKRGYTDLSLAVNGGYDFFKWESLSFFGNAGLSYHMVNPEDESKDGNKITYKQSDLLNYDLGLGGRYALTEKLNVGLSYRYSDTLAKGSMKTAGLIDANQGTTKFKDVSLQQNELIASVGYSF